MVALALGLTGNRETACDLAQEAMLRGYQHWHKLHEFERPGAWVRRVLINLTTDHHRRRATERDKSGRLDRPAHSELAATETDHWWSAVRALPERQRAVVALHYLDDRPVAEVAATLDIPEGTVKSSLARARRTLERTLSETEVER